MKTSNRSTFRLSFIKCIFVKNINILSVGETLKSRGDRKGDNACPKMDNACPIENREEQTLFFRSRHAAKHF